VFLTPATALDAEEFGIDNIETRMLYGGLPPFLMSGEKHKSEYNEWMDSYWAKDITGLFRLEKRDSFMKLMERIFNQSGGMFDAGKFAAACEVSRITVKNYLAALEATAVAYVIRPFSGKNANEIVSMPKIYGFDTGFVSFVKGWDSLRNADYGVMWEHLVLNELAAAVQDGRIYYWRDKQKHEIDFVLKGPRLAAHAIECKWQSARFDPANLDIFRKYHPAGDNYVVSHDITEPRTEKTGKLKIHYIGIKDLVKIASPD
jgi:predicted AAA+ superfamily ATPase